MNQALSLLSGVVLTGVLAGCFPLGSSMTAEKVLAERQLPNGEIEKIVCQNWHRNFFALVGPDGPFQKAYFLDYRYVHSASGKVAELPFLTPGWFRNLQMLQGPAAVPDSDRWVGLYDLDAGRQTVTLKVILFSGKGRIAEHTIENVLRFWENGRLIRTDHLLRCVLERSEHWFRDGKLLFPTSEGNYMLDCRSGELILSSGKEDDSAARTAGTRRLP